MINELIKDTDEKIRLEPGNVELKKLRALLYAASNLYDNALEDLDFVITQFPSDQQAYYLRSDCYINKEQYDLAKQDYLRALKIQFKDDKDFVNGYTEKVISEAKMENQDEIQAIKKILDLEKTQALAQFVPRSPDEKE